MPHHFYLPEIDSNIPVPTEPALWFNNDKKIILAISDGILIDEQAQTRGVSSIPDIWARPLLFQSAIKNTSKHPLRKKCIQEWRGLMSLLALHRIKPELAALEIVAVNLDTEKFSTALKNLVPNPVQLEKDKKYNWTNILMFRFDGIPLGAFSPTTLVYTGADYSKKLKDKPFPFKDKEGFLAPPEKKEDGLEFMGEWLYHLQKKLNPEQNPIFYSEQINPDHQIISNINELIDDWLKEIRQKLGIKEKDPIDVKKFKISDDAIEIKGIAPFINDYNVYERLLHPLQKNELVKDEILISDILLKSSRSTDKKVVIITEKILSEQINIWNELRPKSLNDNPKIIIETFFNASFGTKINNVDIGEEGGLWIRPEIYFLSEKLLKSKGTDILNSTEDELNLGTKYILPFRKEILDFFSPIEIKKILSPLYREDNGVIKFSFNLPVGDSFLKVEKTYKTKITQKEEGEIAEIDVPVIEIFPDYLGEEWRRYYLFQGKAENFFANPILPEKKYFPNFRERDFKNDSITQKVRIYEITGDSSFPEAVEITNEKNYPLGLVLMNKKERIPGLKHKWTVGIDFGTSNTNVYKNRDSDDKAERWTYDFPEYYRSITQSDSNLRGIILQEYFFPTDKVDLPIPTTLKIYNLAKKEAMVLDYFIYYPIEYKFPENVLSDIKWDGEGERKTEYFLESLLFLLLIEVVKNGVQEVRLACSYPKAFSETNIEIFKSEWESIYNKLIKPDQNNNNRILKIHSGSDVDNELKIKIHKPIFKSEGVAAGEFFASSRTIEDISQRADKEIASVCLDVGGGTTDISIWYDNNIEFDASVLLAGRQISNLLQKNSRVRGLLFTKEAAIALEEKQSEPVYFSARLNLIFKKEEERIQEMLIRHANNKDIQWLRQIIALEFGALSFYAAQVCVATNDKVGGLLSRISEAGIKLHWGGNAAKLINWIDFGKYNREGIATKILNAAFINCLNDKTLAQRAIKPKELAQLQSPLHKSEASGGLVVMDLEKNNGQNSRILSSDSAQDEFEKQQEGDDAQSLYLGIICGENIELTDKNIDFFTPLTNKDLFDKNNRTKFKATSLDRLSRFIEVLNFFGIKNGLFTEDTKIVLGDSEKRIIKDGILKEFIKMQSLSEGQRLIEPVFIMEIKLLFEILKSKIN